jgi:hypothetical protein
MEQFMFRNLLGALTISAAFVCCSVPAGAVTVNYALTFTAKGGTATGGTGLLVLNEFPGLLNTINTNGSDHNGLMADFVSLTATINGSTFTFTDANIWSINETNGVWNNISAQSNVTAGSGGHTYRLGTGGLTYNLQDINVTQIGYGVITVGPGVIQSAQGAEIVATTPIPAALPLFATGLVGWGLLACRRKRKALAA